jgi:hypothetical protein
MDLHTFLHTLAPKCQASTSCLGKVVGFDLGHTTWLLEQKVLFSAVAPPLLASVRPPRLGLLTAPVAGLEERL